MTTLVRIIVLIIFNSNILSAQDVELSEITVEIENLESNKGQLLVGLYNKETDFLNTPFKSVKTKISQNKSTITFTDVPVGIYAVSFVHDKNSNGKIDTNFMGIPKEDYGCSNNAKGFMGPPKWKDAKFEFKGGTKTISISL